MKRKLHSAYEHLSESLMPCVIKCDWRMSIIVWGSSTATFVSNSVPSVDSWITNCARTVYGIPCRSDPGVEIDAGKQDPDLVFVGTWIYFKWSTQLSSESSKQQCYIDAIWRGTTQSLSSATCPFVLFGNKEERWLSSPAKYFVYYPTSVGESNNWAR